MGDVINVRLDASSFDNMKDYNGVQGKAGEVNSTKASITNVAPSC
jgi:hypothetical protein